MNHMSNGVIEALRFLSAVLITGALLAVSAECQTIHPDGFWKCRASSSVKGEFAGEDPVGLAGRAHIQTDCVLNASIGGGKTYCFASRPSLEEFENNTAKVLDEATAFWTESQSKMIDSQHDLSRHE